jgi:membrane-associated phospholipid phosphatase
LGGGALLALAAKSVENADRQEKLLDQGVVDGASDLGNVVGSGQFVGGAALALDLGGALLQRPAVLDLGLDLTSTFAVGGAYTWALKTLVRRRRPSGGPFSFPSGHTCSAFAAATVVQRHLGWRVGALAYALAAGTAAGRLEDRRHYLSDVTFGAALGLAVASAVHPEGRAGWTARHLRPSPTGLTLSWGF